MYAVIYECKEAVSANSYVMTHEGETAWLCEEPEGWVDGTGSRGDKSKVNGYAKLFETEEAAHTFMKKYKGHPWYYIPNGSYEVVKIAPRYKKVVEGYDIE